MDIKLACPSCQQHIALDESMRGRSVPCPACGVNMRVPESADSAGPEIVLRDGQPVRQGLRMAILGALIGALLVSNAFTFFLWRQAHGTIRPPAKSPVPQKSVSNPAPIGDPTNALWTAVQRNDANTLRQVLDQHPELVNAPSSLKAKHQAVAQGRLQLVEAFLERKGDANSPDSTGQTLMFNAVFKGNSTMAKLLLKYGAGIHCTRTNSGVAQTLIQAARENNNLSMVDFLRAHGATE